jgi:hypothetical protein
LDLVDEHGFGASGGQSFLNLPWVLRELKGVDLHARVFVARRYLDRLSTAVLQIVVVIAVDEGRA